MARCSCRYRYERGLAIGHQGRAIQRRPLSPPLLVQDTPAFVSRMSGRYHPFGRVFPRTPLERTEKGNTIIGNTKSTPLFLYNIDNQKITYNPTEYEKYTLLHIYFTFNGESIRKMWSCFTFSLPFLHIWPSDIYSNLKPLKWATNPPISVIKISWCKSHNSKHSNRLERSKDTLET